MLNERIYLVMINKSFRWTSIVLRSMSKKICSNRSANECTDTNKIRYCRSSQFSLCRIFLIVSSRLRIAFEINTFMRARRVQCCVACCVQNLFINKSLTVGTVAANAIAGLTILGGTRHIRG